MTTVRAAPLPGSRTQPLELRPRPPYRLDLTVRALRRREQNQIDGWDGRSYGRALLLDGASFELAVTQTGPAARPRLDVRLGGRRRTSAGKTLAPLLEERSEHDYEEVLELTAARAADDHTDELHHVLGLDFRQPRCRQTGSDVFRYTQGPIARDGI